MITWGELSFDVFRVVSREIFINLRVPILYLSYGGSFGARRIKKLRIFRPLKPLLSH